MECFRESDAYDILCNIVTPRERKRKQIYKRRERKNFYPGHYQTLKTLHLLEVDFYGSKPCTEKWFIIPITLKSLTTVSWINLFFFIFHKIVSAWLGSIPGGYQTRKISVSELGVLPYWGGALILRYVNNAILQNENT